MIISSKNIAMLTSAFEKGYILGQEDTKQGIHIDLSQIKKVFLDELSSECRDEVLHVISS